MPTTSPPPHPGRISAACAALALVLTPFLASCGGSDSGNATDASLLTITAERAAYVEGVGLYTPENILYVLPEIDDLPTKGALSQAKSLRAKAVAGDEVVACGSAGNYTIQRRGDITTIAFNQCVDKGTDDDGDAYTTTVNGWMRYTARTAVAGFDTTELVEEDTVATMVYDAKFNISTHTQAHMVLSQAGSKYRVDDARHTLIDKGVWDGVAFDLTSGAQNMQITVSPGGMEYAGRVGTWGVDYEGNPAMGGMVDVRTTGPLVFGNTNGTVIKAGGIRVQGSQGTYGEVVFNATGHATSVNGAPVRSGRW